MKRSMMWLGRLAVATGVAIASTQAFADGAPKKVEPKPATPMVSKASAKLDLFDRLPAGKIDIPKTATLPKSIPATEKAEGFYVEVPSHMKGQQGPTYAIVYGSKEEATARNSGQELPTTNPSCFMNAYPNYGAEINWSSSFSSMASIQNYKSQSYPGAPQLGSVNLVRSDRIVREDKTSLDYEVKLAYVDAETMGVRVISTQKLSFMLVDELPGKVKVWGAKSEDRLVFMVRREKLDKERFFFGPLMVTINGQHVMSSAEACPVVFEMKAGKASAVSAVVQLETLLDITEIKEEDVSNPNLPRLPSSSTPLREAKVRPMRIGISNSWMSQDEKPVVSVSHGWAGKERTQPI